MQFTSLAAFALIALGLAIAPGPNQAYLISRSVCQGRVAGIVSLCGVMLGFVFYALLAAFGIAALLARAPHAFDVLRVIGALYLAWLAWRALRPRGKSPFEITSLPSERPGKLILMGFLTNVLNPKAAALYLSLLPQFIGRRAGGVIEQTLLLGATQLIISFTVNAAVVRMAGVAANVFRRRPAWVQAQRWLMGIVLAGLALHLALVPI